MSVTTRVIKAGMSSEGRPAFEEVRVESCGPGQFKLVQSPGLVLGLAAGDTFTIDDDGEPHVVSRGGNVCVQIFAETISRELAATAHQLFSSIGGRLDGAAAKELVYTVAVKVGFSAIERVVSSIVERHPEAEWIYGNVYDPVDGVTPLRWWEPVG